MSVSRHLAECAERIERLEKELRFAAERPRTEEHVHQWLRHLTEYSIALGDLQRYANESIHERLDALAGRIG